MQAALELARDEAPKDEIVERPKESDAPTFTADRTPRPTAGQKPEAVSNALRRSIMREFEN